MWRLPLLQMLLADFSAHALQTMVALLETCGRYLYLTPETNDRCVRFLDSMMRWRTAKVGVLLPCRVAPQV